jgi:hypothetical protein
MTEPELDLIRRNGSLLREIVSQQVTLKKVGRELKGCCPFHADPDPSFTVYDDGHFYCYGCGAHGNSIDYVMKRDGIGFPQAVKLLQPEVGLTPAQPKKPNGSGVNGVGHAEMWEPIVPPPGDAPPPTEDQLRCDLPNPYTYRDAAGRPLCYVRRFEAKPGKSKLFWPLTFGLLDGKCGWHAKAPATPRPLYGLDRLSQAEPDATVLLCEGEKAADAAQRLFPDFVAMTWMGGANADGGADLSPIEGLSVILWPDADKVGREVMARIAKRLPHATITLNTDGLSDGFDAADLEQEGCADADAWLDARLHEPESPPPEPAPDQEENLPGTEPEPAAKPPELFGVS